MSKIQNHPFQPSPHPDDTGAVCVFPVQKGENVIHCGYPQEAHEHAQHFNERSVPDFDFTKLYYLAGPMSGYPQFNYPAFEAAAWALRNTGIRITSPHEAAWPEGHETMSEEELWQEMMRLTGLQLADAEGIILLRGWPQSRGARAELSIALERTLPVYFYHDFKLVNMNKVEL